VPSNIDRDLSKYSCNDEIVFTDIKGKILDTDSQKFYNDSYGEKVNSFFGFIDHDSDDSSLGSLEENDIKGNNEIMNLNRQIKLD
jgi:hypothetical protein